MILTIRFVTKSLAEQLRANIHKNEEEDKHHLRYEARHLRDAHNINPVSNLIAREMTNRTAFYFLVIFEYCLSLSVQIRPLLEIICLQMEGKLTFCIWVNAPVHVHYRKITHLVYNTIYNQSNSTITFKLLDRQHDKQPKVIISKVRYASTPDWSLKRKVLRKDSKKRKQDWWFRVIMNISYLVFCIFSKSIIINTLIHCKYQRKHSLPVQ